MLAPRTIPERYLRWNKQHNAPYGRDLRGKRFILKLLARKYSAMLLGAFSLQPNNDTRKFEYPWAIEVADLVPGMKVIDLGGGLAGFQFVLDRLGLKVVNVDPGMEAKGIGWPCNQENIDILNSAFRTNVQLVNSTLLEASLSGEIDRIFAISVLEHLQPEEIAETCEEVYRLLKPGGLFILTADLFLDLSPFTSRTENSWGRNYPVGKLLEHHGFEVIVGSPDQLYGCKEFVSDKILSALSEYFVGNFYPVLIQCLVFRKKKE